MFDWDICVSEEKRRNGKELAENQAQAAQRRPLLAAGGARSQTAGGGVVLPIGALIARVPRQIPLWLSKPERSTVSVCDIIPDFFSVISNNILLPFPLLGP